MGKMDSMLQDFLSSFFLHYFFSTLCDTYPLCHLCLSQSLSVFIYFYDFQPLCVCVSSNNRGMEPYIKEEPNSLETKKGTRTIEESISHPCPYHGRTSGEGTGRVSTSLPFLFYISFFIFVYF